MEWNLYSSITSSKNYLEQSYLANYPQCSKNIYFQDVVLLDGRDFRNQVDLFVGGSPSSLLWCFLCKCLEYIHIYDIIKPNRYVT